MPGEPPPAPLVEPSLVGELLFLWTSPGRQGQIPKLLRQQAREELTVDQQRLSGERLHSTLVSDGLKGLMDARLGQAVMDYPGLQSE